MFGPPNDLSGTHIPTTKAAEVLHVFRTFQKLSEIRLVKKGNSFTIFNPLKASSKPDVPIAPIASSHQSATFNADPRSKSKLGKSDSLSLSIKPNGIDQAKSGYLADKREEELEKEQFLLVKNSNIYLKMRLASRRQISVSVLAKIARAEDWRLRALVASNPNTPFSVLAMLAQDKEEDVRAWVAGNRKVDEKILLKLVQDESSLVKARAAGNCKMPSIGLANLVFDSSASVRAAAAVNPAMPKLLLSILITDPSPNVRKRVAKNPNVSATQLLKLIEDSDAAVRLYANARVRRFFNLLRAEQLMVASKQYLPIVTAPGDYEQAPV